MLRVNTPHAAVINAMCVEKDSGGVPAEPTILKLPIDSSLNKNLSGHVTFN